MVYFSFSFMDILHGYYFSGNEWYLIILGISDLTWGFLQLYLQIKTMYWIPNKKEFFSRIVMSPKEAITSSEPPCSYYIFYFLNFSLLKVLYTLTFFLLLGFIIYGITSENTFYSYESIMNFLCNILSKKQGWEIFT